MRNLRLREIQYLSSGHTAKQGQIVTLRHADSSAHASLSGLQDLRVQVPLSWPSPGLGETPASLQRPSSPLSGTTAASGSGCFQDFSAFFSRCKFQGRNGLLGVLQLISAGSQTGMQFSHTGLTGGSCDQQTMECFFIVHINCTA